MENLIISGDRRLTIQIARAIQENLMRNIPVDSIADGIQSVGLTDGGILTHGFVSRGLFRTLNYRSFGKWRKSFRVGGYLLVPAAVLKGNSGET